MEIYRQTNSRKDGVEEMNDTKDLRWEAPKDDLVEVNCNTGVDKNRRNMGIGIIVGDSMGEVLATLSKPKD